MSRVVVLSAAEQVAAYLREEILRGAWSGLMPGGDRLATDLGIGRDTAEAALRKLEKEGLLVNQGRRRGRLIQVSCDKGGVRRIRVAMLLGDVSDRRLDYVIETRHRLTEAGHTVFYHLDSLFEMRMDLKRISRVVEKTAADAWIVMAGSREVLEWFAARETPTFALFGRRTGLPMAGIGPDKQLAMAAATRTLVELGHRRIVMMTREMRRKPEPGAVEQAFLDELVALGIPLSPYHLPDWKENSEGFHARLATLFRVTPPTALILDEESCLVSALEFCAHHGIRMPEDVSMLCTDAAPAFAWYQPTVAHIRWDSAPLARRIVRWAENVSHGKVDVRQTLTQAEFVPGGTIAPVRGK